MALHQGRAVGSIPPGGSPNSPTTSLFPDSGVSVTKLSKPIIIVIAVSGLAGSFVVIVLLFRCFLRPKCSPLPPKQPLASYRQRESKYPPCPHFPHENTGLDQVCSHGSDTSSPSRMPSFRTINSFGTLSSGYRSSRIPTPLNDIPYRPSQLSVESNSDEHPPITQHYVPSTRLARSVSLSRSSQQLSRKGSIASTRSASTYVSTRSINTIRGAPHSPYSNIQIILPVPLAPQLRNHMIENPSVIQWGGGSLEQGSITDRWVTTPIRTTSWRSSSDQSLSIGDNFPGREASPSSKQQDNRSPDNMDQLRRPESPTRPKGRTSSRYPIQRQPLGLGDPTPAPQSPGNQALSTRTTSRDHRGGQVAQLPFERRNRSRSPSDTSKRPFPKYPKHSWHRYTPSWDEQPPPPVPPLPQFPQDLLCGPNTHNFADPISPLSPALAVLDGRLSTTRVRTPDHQDRNLLLFTSPKTLL